MMAVAVDAGETFRAGQPNLLFEGDFKSGYSEYDVSPDGERFLMIQTRGNPAPAKIHVAINWFQELQRLVPTEN